MSITSAAYRKGPSTQMWDICMGFYTRNRNSGFGNLLCIWVLRPLGLDFRWGMCWEHYPRPSCPIEAELFGLGQGQAHEVSVGGRGGETPRKALRTQEQSTVGAPLSLTAEGTKICAPWYRLCPTSEVQSGKALGRRSGSAEA